MSEDRIAWLLKSDEPWTRYRTLVDILDRDEKDEDVRAARESMIAHPKVRDLIEQATEWPGYGLKRHNDAKHPLHQLSTLADFGLHLSDPGIEEVVTRLLAHQDEEGPFQTLAHLYKGFTGIDGEHWTWMMCDAPTILYALHAFGLRDDPRVKRAFTHLLGIVRENGWPCRGGKPLKPSFKGPGKREDPCPYANLISLKVLGGDHSESGSDAKAAGLEVLLGHWNRAYERKLFMFATGSDFRKLKYPYVWYDILHVAEVLSLYPEVFADMRFKVILKELEAAGDEKGNYTATSMYQAWKGWSFANKKKPSPWLTFLVMRIFTRARRLSPVKS